MTKTFWVGLTLLLFVPGLMFAASCAKRVAKPEPVVAKEKAKAGDEERARQKALEKRRLREQRLRQEASARRQLGESAEQERFLNEHVYFQFDKSRLLPEAKKILRRKAKWLRAHSEVLVVVEGHCDERGTNEYNMALGDRRTRSAKNYLVDLGIARQRFTTISYGEERPLDTGHNEDAWAKNRRAQFVTR